MSFRARVKRASPESITTIGSMDSGLASLILRDAAKWPLLRMRTPLHRHRVELVFLAHQLDMGAHRGGGAGAVAAQDRHHHPVVLGVRFCKPSEIAELGAAERLHPN